MRNTYFNDLKGNTSALEIYLNKQVENANYLEAEIIKKSCDLGITSCPY